MSPVDAMLAYYSDRDYFARLVRREIKPIVTRAIPFIERAKWMCVREFLESDLTVHDMMERLGKRRPHDVYKMLFTITKKEARTGFYFDGLAKVFDATFVVKVIPKDDDTFDVTCSLVDKIEGINDEPLTLREHAVMTALLDNPKTKVPSLAAREHWKNHKANLSKEELAEFERMV